MASLTYLLFFFVVLILFVFGGQAIMVMLEEEHMADYTYLWRNVTDSTDINSSGYLNLSTQRTSAGFDGNLTITYQGGDNSTDYIQIGWTRIGNITAGRSPATYTVPGNLIDVPCAVYFGLNASATNITHTDLDYYSYDGCEYAEDTCDALAASMSMAGAVFTVPPFFIFIFAMLIVFVALRGLLFR